MRKPVFPICKQQRRRSACAFAQSDQHLSCSLLRQYNTCTCYIKNFKTLASFCGCSGWFESTLVGNPEEGFLWKMKKQITEKISNNLRNWQFWNKWKVNSWLTERKLWKCLLKNLNTVKTWFTRKLFLVIFNFIKILFSLFAHIVLKLMDLKSEVNYKHGRDSSQGQNHMTKGNKE